MTSIKDITHKDDYDPNTESWNGMSVIPPFKICSSLNPQYQARPIIASIGIPEEIKNQMIKDSEEFENIINFKLNNNSFRNFSSIEEMEKFIKDPHYAVDKII